MPDVFISYSRVEKDFVRQLHTALAEQGRDTWVDWEDIEYAEDWWQKICAGIEGADNFVFVITPNSVRSKVCFDEIEHAVKNNKRIVPILRHEVTESADQQRMHPAISKHNWLPFQDDPNFAQSFAELIETVNTEPDHVRVHTRLLVRAREWLERRRAASLLLRGDDLGQAEAWLTSGVNKQPSPTELHAEYISASRQAQTQRTRLLLGGVSVALVVAVVLGLAAFGSQQQAVAESARANANAANAVFNEQISQSIALSAQAQLELQGRAPERGVLLSLAALEQYPYTVQAERALAIAAQESRLRMILDTAPEYMLSAVWSPDGSRIAASSMPLNLGTGDSTDTIRIWDAESGQQLQVFPTDETMGGYLTWSPDSTQLLMLSSNGAQTTIHLFNAETGETLHEFDPLEGYMANGVWSPDSKRIAVYGTGAIVFDVASGEVLLEVPPDTLEYVTWTSDSQQILIAPTSAYASLWDIDSGQEVSTLFGRGADLSP